MYVKKNNRPAPPAAPPTRHAISFGQPGTRDRNEGRAMPKYLQSYVTKTSGTKYPWLRDPRKPELEPITDKLPRLVERPAPDAPKLNPSIAAYLGGIDPSTVSNYCAAEVPMLMRAAIGKRAIERNAFDPNRDYSKHGSPVAKVQQSPISAQIEQKPKPWSPSYTDVLLNRCYDPVKPVYGSSGGFAMKKAPTNGNAGASKKNASYAEISSNRIKGPAPMNDLFPPLETEWKRSKDKPMPLIEKKKQRADGQNRFPVKAAPEKPLLIPSSKTKSERKTYSLGQSIPIDPELVAIRQRKLKEAERLKAERLKQIEEKAAMEKAKKERIEHEEQMHEIKMERARRQELMEIEKERKRAKQRERQYKDSLGSRSQMKESKLRQNEEKVKLSEPKLRDTSRIRTVIEENKSMDQKNRAPRERYDENVSPKQRGIKKRTELPRTEAVYLQMEDKMSPTTAHQKEASESYRRKSLKKPRPTTGEWEQKFYFGDPLAGRSTQKCVQRDMELENSLPIHFEYTDFRAEWNDLATPRSDDEVDEDERRAYEAKIHKLHEALKLQSLRSARKEKPTGFDFEKICETLQMVKDKDKKESEQKVGRDWDWSDYKAMTSNKITMVTDYEEVEVDNDNKIYKQAVFVKARKNRSRRSREGESLYQIVEDAATSVEEPIAAHLSNDEQEFLNEQHEYDGFVSRIPSSKTNQDMRKSTMAENPAVDEHSNDVQNINKKLLAEQIREHQRNRDETKVMARNTAIFHNPTNESKCSEPILEDYVEPRPARKMEDDKAFEFGSSEEQKKIPEDSGLSEDFEAFMKRNGLVIHSVIYPEPGEDFRDFLNRKERIQLEREEEQKLGQNKVESAKASEPPKNQEPVFKAPEALDLTVYGKKISITDDLLEDKDFLNLGDEDEYIEEDDESYCENLEMEKELEADNFSSGDLMETTQDGSSFFPEMSDFETFMEKNNMIIDQIVYPEFGEDPEDFKKRKEMTILRNRQIKQEENRKKFAIRCDSPDENLECQRNLVEFFSNRPTTAMEAGDSPRGISNVSYEIPENCSEMADIPGLFLKKNGDGMEPDATTEPEHRELFWEEDITADRLEAKYKWWKIKQEIGLRYQSPAFR